MKNIVKSFLKSDKGNFGIILGLTLTPIVMSAGVAIDYSSFKRMEARMELSAEAAMLSASKEVVRIREQDFADNGAYNLTNAQIVTELDKVFKPFFEANFSAGGYELLPGQYTLEYIEADNNTKVLVTMNYDTAVMKAFGTNTLEASKEMIINLKVQPRNYVIDIVMCIDATGSMQNTLNAVQASAKTFNNDLRQEMGVGQDSEKLKIRVRPMFYRDWEEGQTYLNQMTTYNSALAQYNIDLAAYNASLGSGGGGGGSTAYQALRDNLEDDWNDSNWYYKNGSKWKKSSKSYHPKTHKRVKYNNKWYYFESVDAMNLWLDGVLGENTMGGGTGPTLPEPTPPVKPVNYGLTMADDFIDLDPNESTGDTKEDQNNELKDFLSSTYAFGGHDLPESAGACMNEAIRSDWFDNQSAEAKEYFNVPAGDLIIKEYDEVPAQSYTKITPIPVIVFWSDAAIQSLQKSRDYLSPTTPTTYPSLENVWKGIKPSGETWNSYGASYGKFLDQTFKMMIRFGPQSISGWNDVKDWNKVYYGGSLSTGNSQAVKVIAKEILKAVPDLLRVGS